MKRRTLFKFSGLAIGSALIYRPAYRFIQKILESKISEQGWGENQSGRNYVQINLYGAPSRWGFDNLLKPFDDSPFIKNPFVGNSIKRGESESSQYQIDYITTNFKGINVPKIWDEKCLHTPESKLSEVLENALFIRGCRLNFEGHPINGAQQVAPVTGETSIHGVLADKSNRLFKSVSVGNNPVSRAFKSKANPLSQVPVGEKNYAEFLLRPFLIEDSKRVFDMSDLKEDIELLSQFTDEKSQKMADIKKEALKDIRENIDQFIEEFAELALKYRNLINQAFSTTSFQDIIATPTFPFEVSGKKDVTEAIGPFAVLNQLCQSENLSEFFTSGQINYWAQEFALCEFLLVNHLCQSILISPPVETGDLIVDCHGKNVVSLKDFEARYDKSKNKTIVKLKENVSPVSLSFQNIQMDSHQNGAYIEIMGTNYFYRAFTHCLHELTSTLKKKKIKDGKSLFDETVIHIASEFDRNPTVKGEGSSHLPYANPTLILSGLIPSPQLIGDIYTGTLKKNKWDYYGTLGIGAYMQELGDYINIGHVSSTVCKLLQVDPIVRRARSLGELKNGQFVSRFSKARNVDGIV